MNPKNTMFKETLEILNEVERILNMVSELEGAKWHQISKVIPDGHNVSKLEFSQLIADIGDKLQVVRSRIDMIHSETERYPDTQTRTD